jgi:hypothetical protein
MGGTIGFVDNVPQGTVMTLRISNSPPHKAHLLQVEKADFVENNLSEQDASQTAFDNYYGTTTTSSSSSSNSSSVSSLSTAGPLSPGPQLQCVCPAEAELLVQTMRVLVSEAILTHFFLCPANAHTISLQTTCLGTLALLTLLGGASHCIL